MEQIADWLKKLGMSEYAECFAENDIDIDVLSELTDQDLEKLGVSLGHRRKMLRAIRDLGGASVAVTAPSRRPSQLGQNRWRGRDRQIAAHSGPFGKSQRRATYTLALFLLSAAHRQRALSDYWPDGTCC
jgi:hypothetical protein